MLRQNIAKIANALPTIHYFYKNDLQVLPNVISNINALESVAELFNLIDVVAPDNSFANCRAEVDTFERILCSDSTLGRFSHIDRGMADDALACLRANDVNEETKIQALTALNYLITRKIYAVFSAIGSEACRLSRRDFCAFNRVKTIPWSQLIALPYVFERSLSELTPSSFPTEVKEMVSNVLALKPAMEEILIQTEAFCKTQAIKIKELEVLHHQIDALNKTAAALGKLHRNLVKIPTEIEPNADVGTLPEIYTTHYQYLINESIAALQETLNNLIDLSHSPSFYHYHYPIENVTELFTAIDDISNEFSVERLYILRSHVSDLITSITALAALDIGQEHEVKHNNIFEGSHSTALSEEPKALVEFIEEHLYQARKVFLQQHCCHLLASIEEENLSELSARLALFRVIVMIGELAKNLPIEIAGADDANSPLRVLSKARNQILHAVDDSNSMDVLLNLLKDSSSETNQLFIALHSALSLSLAEMEANEKLSEQACFDTILELLPTVSNKKPKSSGSSVSRFTILLDNLEKVLSEPDHPYKELSLQMLVSLLGQVAKRLQSFCPFMQACSGDFKILLEHIRKARGQLAHNLVTLGAVGPDALYELASNLVTTIKPEFELTIHKMGLQNLLTEQDTLGNNVFSEVRKLHEAFSTLEDKLCSKGKKSRRQVNGIIKNAFNNFSELLLHLNHFDTWLENAPQEDIEERKNALKILLDNYASKTELHPEPRSFRSPLSPSKFNLTNEATTLVRRMEFSPEVVIVHGITFKKNKLVENLLSKIEKIQQKITKLPHNDNAKLIKQANRFIAEMHELIQDLQMFDFEATYQAKKEALKSQESQASLLRRVSLFSPERPEKVNPRFRSLLTPFENAAAASNSEADANDAAVASSSASAHVLFEVSALPTA